MNKEKIKRFNRTYFNFDIDSKWSNIIDKTFFLLSATLFTVTFLVYLVFQIIGYEGGSYMSNLLQLFLGLVLLCLPVIFRRLNLYVNVYLAIIWYIYIIAAFYVGFNFEVYKSSDIFDKIVHFYSGAVIGLIGVSFAGFTDKPSDKFRVFITILATSALAGMVWEIAEFAIDGWFGENMQRYSDVDSGSPYIGRRALQDTMFDCITDIGGALIPATILMFLKLDKIKRLAIRPKSSMLLDKKNNA